MEMRGGRSPGLPSLMFRRVLKRGVVKRRGLSMKGRGCVVIVESLLLMMVGLERGPFYMINQLLSILSGVDIKVRNTCTCNDVHVIIIIVHVLRSIPSSLCVYPLYGPSLSLLV